MMTDASIPTEAAHTPPLAPDPGEASERRCLACGYNLRGLGDEPRCPECGLLNIPEEYRKQVWELIDSGRWFFSGFFTPFRKRLPGWWWALDREGDVKRSFRFAGLCILIGTILIVGSSVVGDALAVEQTGWLELRERQDPTAKVAVTDPTSILVVGIGGTRHRHDSYPHQTWHPPRPWTDGSVLLLQTRSSRRILIDFTLEGLAHGILVALLVIMTWAGPATVGLWTQLRKGLPSFARAPRTIIAAANYEAHRLLYAAVLVVFVAGVDLLLRRVVVPLESYEAPDPSLVLCLFLLAMGSFGWVGPLRSDYTRQLIRSRRHAVRIVLMYALVLPCVVVLSPAWLVHVYVMLATM
jgi:hypothetical protein